MSLESALAGGRAAALARMTSVCNVRRKSGTSTTGGVKSATYTIIHTALACRVGGANTGSTGSRTLDAGGVNVDVPLRVASLPYDTTDLRDGDLIEVTSGDSDGLVLRVVEADFQDQATARRLLVVGTEAPEEW